MYVLLIFKNESPLLKRRDFFLSRLPLIFFVSDDEIKPQIKAL